LEDEGFGFWISGLSFVQGLVYVARTRSGFTPALRAELLCRKSGRVDGVNG
jgi:hypothetical protein